MDRIARTRRNQKGFAAGLGSSTPGLVGFALTELFIGY
jgi:hypothetical protein